MREKLWLFEVGYFSYCQMCYFSAVTVFNIAKKKEFSCLWFFKKLTLLRLELSVWFLSYNFNIAVKENEE